MTNFSLSNKKELYDAVQIEISQFIYFSNECYGGMVAAWLVVDPLKGCVYVSKDKSEIFGFVDVYFINDFIQIGNEGFEPNQKSIDEKFYPFLNDDLYELEELF